MVVALDYFNGGHVLKQSQVNQGSSVNTLSSYFFGPRKQGEGVETSENLMLEGKLEEKRGEEVD